MHECASWAASRVTGTFYLAAESDSGAAILVQSSKTVQEVHFLGPRLSCLGDCIGCIAQPIDVKQLINPCESAIEPTLRG